eukprot:gene5708-7878_t
MLRSDSSVESDKKDLTTILNEDELRLAKLGYNQEVKRIFSVFTTFGLAASMISVLLGIIPLYTFSLQTGGPVVMLWSWVGIGICTTALVGSLAEICSAFPTMGALYYWAYRLGGPEWGRFASWTAGWCNLIGQIAGVASGGYSGAQIIANIVFIQSGYNMSAGQIQALYLAVLALAGVVNTFSETMLTTLCYISVGWHVIGTLVIVIWMVRSAPTLQPASFVFGDFNNQTGFSSVGLAGMIGCLAAASTFTGYDTAAHVAEETTNSHQSTPLAMMFSIVNCFVLGLILIIGMNSCIQDLGYLTQNNSDQQAYTLLWQQVVGNDATIFFLVIVFVGIECSNCANLTSASRMIYSFARDDALPFSSYWYHMDKEYGCPLRSIWLCTLIAFLLGMPGLVNQSVLSALFSLTATGLYASYMIPILLRVTVSRNSFVPAEFNLGIFSIPVGIFSTLWCMLMVIVLCLPTNGPVSLSNMNYSPIVLGGILIFAWTWWAVSARHWFKGAKITTVEAEDLDRLSRTIRNSKDEVTRNSLNRMSFSRDGNYNSVYNHNHKHHDLHNFE